MGNKADLMSNFEVKLKRDLSRVLQQIYFWLSTK